MPSAGEPTSAELVPALKPYPLAGLSEVHNRSNDPVSGYSNADEAADYGASPSKAECITALQSSVPRVRSCRSAMRQPSGRRTTESW